MKRIILLLMVIIPTFLITIGCLAKATATENEQVTLRMAHGISNSSPSGEAVNNISNLVEETSNGQVKLETYGSGVLGSERDTVEMVQSGTLDMAKVGASTLDAFEPLYGVFSLPYMFDSEDDLYAAMTTTDAINILNDATRDDGFIMIGWYTSGYRNFYTAKDTPIKTPDDLAGLKIRVMESATSQELVSMMGASPVPMSSSETYTAMQQGVVDGAENNEIALMSNQHKDVAKNYSYTQHQLVPDIYIMSTETADSLTDEQLYAVEEAIWESNLEYRDLNQQMINDSIAESIAGCGIPDSKEACVEFVEVDKEPFKEKVAPMKAGFAAKGDIYAELLNEIESAAGKEADYDAPKIK